VAESDGIFQPAFGGVKPDSLDITLPLLLVSIVSVNALFCVNEHEYLIWSFRQIL
jgi:hypothetical protein